MAKYQTVPATQIPELMKNDGALLLDCRMLSDYRSEHIENAIHVHDELVESLVKKADRSKHLVIYCYHGHNSEHLSELMSHMGFRNVFNIAGGYESWKKSCETPA